MKAKNGAKRVKEGETDLRDDDKRRSELKEDKKKGLGERSWETVMRDKLQAKVRDPVFAQFWAIIYKIGGRLLDDSSLKFQPRIDCNSHFYSPIALFSWSRGSLQRDLAHLVFPPDLNES